MSPGPEPQAFRSPVGAAAGGRLLGLRESNQALAELKTKLEFALSRLNDQDTQRPGVEEIREFLQTLYPDWFPMVISCIGEASTNLKPLGRCESVKLLGVLAELHGEAVIPLLQRILQVVVSRLQDADLHLRDACAETVLKITQALVVDGADGSPVFASLLKPLFGALGEHNKSVQIGAAACICSVIQGSPQSVLQENLGRLCSRLVQHLNMPLLTAKPQLLSACVYAMQAVQGSDFDEVLPSLMPCLEGCSSSADWQTRKQAVEVMQTVGDNMELGISLDLALPQNPLQRPTPLQRRIAPALEALKADKVRAVREAAKDALVRWCVETKAPVASTTGVRASSPGIAAASAAPGGSGAGSAGGLAWPDTREARPTHSERRGTNTARSCSPTPSTWIVEGKPNLEGKGNARSVRAFAMNPSTEASPPKWDLVVDPEASTRDVALTEKDKKNNAVKAALLGADLSATKKPKPKRERVSIFRGPTNSGFFRPAPAGGPAGGAEEGSGAGGNRFDFGAFSGMPFTDEPAQDDDHRSQDGSVGGAEDQEPMPTPTLDAPSGFEAEVASEAQSAPSSAQVPPGGFSDDGEAVLSSSGRRAAGGACVGAGSGVLSPRSRLGGEEAAGPLSASAAAQRRRAGLGAQAPLGANRAPAAAVGHEGFSGGSGGAGPPNGGIGRRRAPGQVDSPRRLQPQVPVLTDISAAAAAPATEWPWEAEPVGGSSRGLGSAAPLPHGHVGYLSSSASEMLSTALPSVSSGLGRSEDSSNAASVRMASQLEAFAERLSAIEDTKRQVDVHADRLRRLEQTCEFQAEQLLEQAEQLAQHEKRLEAQEGRIKAQEDQLAVQDQKISEQEQQLLEQDQVLQQQEAQIQQQDQMLEQQDCKLTEYEQRREGQDKQVEQQAVLLSDLVVASRDGKEQHQQLQLQQQQQHSLLLQQLQQQQQQLQVLALGNQSWGEEAAVFSQGSPADRLRGNGCGSTAGSVSSAAVGPRPPPLYERINSANALGSGSGAPHEAGAVVAVRSGSGAPAPMPLPSNADAPGGGAGGASSLSQSHEWAQQVPLDTFGGGAASQQPRKTGTTTLWDRVVDLCEAQRFLEAYKQVIAEPEEACLLRLMQHTGPIVEHLDAESNSRLIRRLIHILSSPGKDPAASSIEQIFGWLRQALKAGIHFTASQVEDLASALQRVAAAHSPLPVQERAEASQLLSRVSALRRM